MKSRRNRSATMDASISEDTISRNEDERMGERLQRKRGSIANNDDITTRPVLNRRVTPSPEPNAQANKDTPGPPNIRTPPVQSPEAEMEANGLAPPADTDQDTMVLVSAQAMAPTQYASAFGHMPNVMARFDETINAAQAVAAAANDDEEEEDIVIVELNVAQARKLLEAEEKQDWKRAQKELDAMFEKQSENKYENIPPFVRPPGLKDSITLYPYQQDGIRWLLHQETNDDRVPPFWKQQTLGGSRNQWWRCNLTGKMQKNQPKSCQGSILADGMGLGKTMQSIGLILSNPPEEDEPRCTLIVAPVSVIANWKTQIEQFVEPDFLEMAIYHGSKREQVLNKVKKGQLDIVLSSYETIVSDLQQLEQLQAEMEEIKAEEAKQKKASKRAKRNEVRDAWDGSEDDWEPDSSDDDEDDHHLPASVLKKRKRTPVKKTWIFDIEFHRIILDEAHKIRNSNTKFFQSMMRIPAQRKLCLTGTPFVNRPSDIHSLLAFLGAEPLSDKSLFAGMVVQPIMEAKEIGLARIRTMMSHLALRRTKASVGEAIELVPKKVVLHHVEFADGFHGATHDVLYETARAAFISLLRSGNSIVFRNFYAFLVLVLRVRQSCCSGYLVPEEARLMAEEIHSQIESGEVDLDAVEGEELLKKLMNVLKGDQEVTEYEKECAVCCNDLEEETAVILRTCKHVLCQSCLDQIDKHLCPFCRKSYNPSDMIKKTVAEAASKKESNRGGKAEKARPEVDEDGEVHPKVQTLLDIIATEMAPDEKGVVFSQWTGNLNIIAAALARHGHSTTRIDGTMSAVDRIKAMEDFTDGEPRFILCSLHAAGCGINLIRGNHCFVMDTWWNAAIEEQAMDRVHRIGQTRPVKVHRLIVKDSIEERMVNLQEAKSALGKGSLQKLTPEERKKARITALKDLFQVEGDVAQKWEGYYEDEEDDNGDDLKDFIVDDDVCD